MSKLKRRLQNSDNLRSSSLGKKIAKEALHGDKLILKGIMKLSNSKDKNIRAGVAKVCEVIAEEKPGVVSKHLSDLFSLFEVPEAQTRWMVIRTFGLCASSNSSVAIKALLKAGKYIKDPDSGACLWNRTIFYLGEIGAVSREYSRKILPVLEQAVENVPGQENAILNAFENMLDKVGDEGKNKIYTLTEKYLKSSKKSTKSKANKIIKKLELK